jgi:hypothetical protein
MEEGAAKFAIGLLLLWGGALCFFFALHPGGQGFKNPTDAIKWMITQVQKTQGGTTSGTSTGGTSSSAP